MENLNVIKRDGTKQPFVFEKIHGHSKWACEGLEGVSQSELESRMKVMFFDGMKTRDIAIAMRMAAAQLIEKHHNYDFVTARLLLQEIYKDVTGGSIKYPHLKSYLERGVNNGILDEVLLHSRFDHERLDSAIEQGRDFLFKYMGLQTLADRYFQRELRKSGEEPSIIELPQHFWMRVAMGLAINEDDPTARAIEFYNVMSVFDYVPSTPTLFNAGTKHPQLSSCYGTYTPDDLEGIFDYGIKGPAMLSKFSGGVGSDWTALRAAGSVIKSTNGKSTGPIPFLKIYNDTAVAVNQGGKRKGAFAPYLEIFHADIEDFLDTKRKTGDERLRTHDVNPVNWIPSLFFERLDEDGEWSLFCPSEVPGLHDCYGDDFKRLYEEAEAAGLARKKIKAMDLWKKMLDVLTRFGGPWITFKDESNRRNPQQHCGFVHNSNLCTEIILNNSVDETFVCNLGSLNLSQVCQMSKLRTTIKTAMRMLDNVIDINYYPTKESRKSNLRHRPVGLGVMGFAEALVQHGIDWESEDAIKFADELFEAISYYTIEASMELAVERGVYETFEGSLWSKGILTIDTARDQSKHVFSEVDWQKLRDKVKYYGVRNCNMIAIAPTATISNIVGTTPCIEPIFERITDKQTLSGLFKVPSALAKYNRPDLEKTVWEVDMQWLILNAAVRQKWIDQAQSLNLYRRPEHRGRDLDRWYRLAHEKGLKTTYYLRQMKADVDTLRETVVKKDETEPAPVMCSIDNPDCEACQ